MLINLNIAYNPITLNVEFKVFILLQATLQYASLQMDNKLKHIQIFHCY